MRVLHKFLDPDINELPLPRIIEMVFTHRLITIINLNHFSYKITESLVTISSMVFRMRCSLPVFRKPTLTRFSVSSLSSR